MTRRSLSRGSMLATARPADTAVATLYTPDAAVIEATLRTLWVCNTSASAATFRVLYDPDGTTFDETTALVWDLSIPAGRYQPLEWDGRVVILRPGGALGIRSGTGNALTFTLFGEEIR